MVDSWWAVSCLAMSGNPTSASRCPPYELTINYQLSIINSQFLILNSLLPDTQPASPLAEYPPFAKVREY
jgi:hypothetical protein